MGLFAPAMTDSITVEAEQGQDKYGDISYGPAREVSCRIQHGTERIRDAAGVILDVKDVIYSEEVIHKSSRLTLPDGSKVVPSQVSRSQAVGLGQLITKVVL